jgi:hypothetical protein
MCLQNEDNRTAGVPFVSLLVFASVLFLAGLGKRHLWDGETREAGIMAEMARSKDFVVPRLNGQPFLEKPPLYYWVASPVFRSLGENTYSAKIPSALAAIGGVLVVFILAQKMGFSLSTAFVSAWVLATSAEYWSLGRQCMIDMTLCLFVTGAMLCFFQASRSETDRTLWGAGFVLSLACAVLTKGLVGLAIPLSALTIWLLARKDFSFRAWFPLIFGTGLCLVPVALWIYLLCRQLGGDMVYKAMLANSFGRFTGSYAEHVEPFYYYLMKFPPQLFPWVLFVRPGNPTTRKRKPVAFHSRVVCCAFSSALHIGGKAHHLPAPALSGGRSVCRAGHRAGSGGPGESNKLVQNTGRHIGLDRDPRATRFHLRVHLFQTTLHRLVTPLHLWFLYGHLGTAPALAKEPEGVSGIACACTLGRLFGLRHVHSTYL